jgi:ATP-dependent DNA ligase
LPTYGREGGTSTSNRVLWMIDALAYLKGVRSLVIDGELVACNDAGVPDFSSVADNVSHV